MKILIIDIYYSGFLSDFYKKNPKVLRASYKEQKNALMKQYFGTGNFYSKNLKKLGHEAEEVIFNAEILQTTWAKEHGVKYRKIYSYVKNIPKVRSWFRTDWDTNVLEAQIKNFNPDVIYCQSLSAPSPEIMRKLKKYTRLLVGQVACPTDFDREKLAHFDLIFTSFPHFIQKFKEIGIHAEYLKIAFEPKILEKITKSKEQYGTVFVGGISKHHTEIMETFEYLAQNTDIDFFGYGKNKLPIDSAIRRKHHGEAWGLDMYNILANSKISVNRHIDAAENNANNMRLYESTGVGAMLLTDMKDNLHELFEIGKEVETYETKEELLEKITYYLAHDDERKRIAKAGQERTLKEHTYAHRMKEVSDILEKHLATKIQ